MVERQNIRNCLVQVFRLVKHSLSMESSYILVEIYCEEVEASSTTGDCCSVVLQDVVEICRSFCCNRAHLFVAASISRYEKHWDAFDLKKVD